MVRLLDVIPNDQVWYNHLELARLLYNTLTTQENRHVPLKNDQYKFNVLVGTIKLIIVVYLGHWRIPC